MGYEVASKERIEQVVGTVTEYMDAFERMDADGMLAVLSKDEISISYPFHESGLTEPGSYRSHSGREHVEQYLRGEGEHVGFARYTSMKFLDSVYRPVADGNAVYLENRGDMIMRDGSSYRNYYVFRFDFSGDVIVNIAQYHNPVTSLVPYGRVKKDA